VYCGTSKIQVHVKYPTESTNKPELNAGIDEANISLLTTAVSLTDKCKQRWDRVNSRG